jgi:gluconate 2-dehydrogenase gamma chain
MSASPPAPRREFLKRVVGMTTVIPVAPAAAAFAATAPASTAQAADAPEAPPAPPAGYECFGPAEAAFVEAMVNVMCPADGLTPSGVDCGLALFIDRQLAGAFGKGDRYYMQGPWRAARPQLGLQLPMIPEQFFRAGLAAANDACRKAYGKGLDQLGAPERNAFLEQLASGKLSDPRVPLARWFNELVYPLFEQACFADPMYGGNREKVFWKLIGYPGLPAVHTQNMVAFRGKPFPPAKTPQSIQDFS